MKKTIISVTLALAMLIAFTPTALCAEPVTLDALSDANAGDTVTISGTATLSEVSIKVIKPDKTILFINTVVPSGSTFSTTITLPEDLATGTYTVTAGSGSTTATTTLSVTALPPIQLATPAKPSLSGGIASWTAVVNENNGYSLKLYRDGSLAGTVSIAHGAALSYDLSTAMTVGGNYTVTVTALGAGRYVDSEPSPESDPQVITVKVTGVAVKQLGISLLVGNSQTLTAVFTPESASNQTVTWSSSDTTVASVDANGKVTGVAAGTATITVTTADGGFTAPCTVTVTSGGSSGGGSSGGGSSGGGSSGGGSGSSSSEGSNTPATSDYTADVEAGDGLRTTLPVAINKDNGTVSIDVSTQSFVQGGTVITIPSIPDADTYSVGISVPELSTTGAQRTLTIRTEAGSVTVPSNMLTDVAGISGSKAQISIGQGDKGTLPVHVKAAIGDKPLIQLTLSIDGKQADWKNPNAPVTVSIPYTPTAAELANPESIVVWYIDGSGNAVSVPNGRYDPATGTVTFFTTHFSDFAVGYNKVSFNDVTTGAWYNKAVSFIAARGITGGTGNGNFSPDAKLTRGEFLVMLMKAYGIAPDTNSTDNFSDAGNTYYTGYLAAAKRLGITTGIGNNQYVPGKEITRQEMFTLLYNALKVIGQLPQGDSGKTLSNFIDAGQINSWAKDAMTLLVETGTVGGSGGKLSPTATTTRAEMAQVLYSLLSK